ncbi:MAG: glycerol kinase GlpK [Trueperaceae bacterium]|nr:glycerol kinase GlpK [Trueperaceae bacterium]MCW5819993.1 glycerol kinase GlpK [Trueperaceae bacterium]
MTASPLVLALDQGTTSSRAILFDVQGRVLGSAQKEFPQSYPRPGWVEHDPLDLWSSQVGVAGEALARAGVPAARLAAVAITNQRETAVVYDRSTLRPIANAVVWQDRRTAAEVARLRADGVEELVRAKTGLLLDPYFSATKVAWLLDNVPGARERAEAGELAFGTVDTWLSAKLTGGREHVTDVSNASRTQLFDIHRADWDDDLLALFRVPRALMPRVVPTSGVVAEITEGPLAGAPIAALVGDQQAATFGQACFAPGQAKATYGTGAFLVLNTGAEAQASRSRLLTTVAWSEGGRLEYALEGSIFMAGAVVQWLRDGLGIIREASDVGKLAAGVPDSGGVMFVPAMTGLGAPHWDSGARGTVVGLTRGTTAAHLARAALEGIALQVADVVAAMQADAGPVGELRVDGGASRSDELMQLQADVLGVDVLRAEQSETTALGAAYLAGLAVGAWPDRDALAAQWRAGRRFQPRIAPRRRAALKERWAEAVERSKGWVDGRGLE